MEGGRGRVSGRPHRARLRRGRRAGRRAADGSPGVGRVLDLDDDRAASVFDRTSSLLAPGVEVADTDEAVLVFSSGTTGTPKAVRHTHGSMHLATSHWCRALGLGHDDRFQVATPPSHILGLLNLLAAAAAGATVRLHRRFDLDEELRFIEEESMNPRDGGCPDRAGPGQPSGPGAVSTSRRCATSCGGPRR